MSYISHIPFLNIYRGRQNQDGIKDGTPVVSQSTYFILTDLKKKEGQVGTLHLRVFIFIMILVFHSSISFNIKWSKRKSALVLTSIIQSSHSKNVQDGLVKKWQKNVQFRISTLGVPPGEKKIFHQDV